MQTGRMVKISTSMDHPAGESAWLQRSTADQTLAVSATLAAASGPTETVWAPRSVNRKTNGDSGRI